MFTDKFKVVRTSSRLPAVQLSPVVCLVCWTSPVSMITGTIKLRSPHHNTGIQANLDNSVAM